MTGSFPAAPARDRPATYREVFGNVEFQALYTAQVASLLGDQAAKVALAIIVLDRSDNPLLAALAYAVGYLPWIVGGPVLSPLADRLPRRSVMVACDAVRAVAVGAMALPGLPLWLLFALLLSASLLMAPFEAARAATLPDVLDGDAYVVASSVNSVTNQLCQVTGFVLGGAAVVVLSPRGALAADAVSFAVSAVVIWWGVKHRPAVRRAGRPTLAADMAEGARVVFGSPVLRSILLLAWIGATFSIVPEGLAVTYAERLGYGALATGFLTAAMPFGLAVGALVVGRILTPSTRLRVMRPLAAAAFLPLLATALKPPLWCALVLWALTGAAMAYQVPANAAFMVVVPADARGRAFGLAQSGLQALQGVSLAAAGALALVLPVHRVVAVFGVAGLVAVAVLGIGWPTRELAALHPPATPPLLTAPGTQPPLTMSWAGPYPLAPRRRTLLVPLLAPTREPPPPP